MPAKERLIGKGCHGHARVFETRPNSDGEIGGIHTAVTYAERLAELVV